MPDAGETLHLVSFRRGDARFAIDVAHVRRALRPPPLRSVTAAPPFVAGGVTVDGRLEVLLDPGLLFDLAERGDTAPERALLVRCRDGEFGLLADSIDEVAPVPAEQVQPPPPFVGGARRAAIRGVVALERGEVLLLDLDRLLRDDERTTVLLDRPPAAR